MSVKDFIKKNFRHFNAAAIVDASEGWLAHDKKGGKMFLALAGAMSTGEIGLTLGELVRRDKIHAVSCTAANLEEDIFNLVAHKDYRRIPHYRDLSKEEELELRKKKLNRVTDTCIPEEEAIRKIGRKIFPLFQKADKEGKSYFPYEYFYKLIKSGELEEFYQIDPRESWVVACCEKDIPVFTPGWEDSTSANGVVADYKLGKVSRLDFIKSGLEQMDFLIDWYMKNTKESSVGFFQIGGGIAGDFPICVAPLIRQDMEKDCKLWGYFCQISDSTTSYGSYSGAVPNEKITWEKLDIDTPKFVIESDASIVAPLIFRYILESC